MLTSDDLKTIQEKGLTQEIVQAQIERFKIGFPYLKVIAAAIKGNGVIHLTQSEETECTYAWENYLLRGGTTEQFIPASGAASRMFKNLYEFLSSKRTVPETAFEKYFFSEIKNFAFYNSLNEACEKKLGLNIEDLLSDGHYGEIVRLLLNPEGLNYGALPKGVLKFHKNGDVETTAIEEHLSEAAQYAVDKNRNVNLHFTVSPEHKELFHDLILRKKIKLEDKYGVHYNVTMSEQKSSTDTIAVNMDNTPFRNLDGSLLFRPAGHGALIENLNEQQQSIVFIKNVDNVVPDSHKADTVKYKKILGGYLVLLHKQISKYLILLQSGNYTINDLLEIIHFMHDKLCLRYKDTKHFDDSELAIYLMKKLNRPIRVCGMVRNDGEPGGGPFVAENPDGSTSLQILESSQFDSNNKETMTIMKESTYFNPVDLACFIKDINGNKFDLTKYVDKNTGFISIKSKDGKELKALELPGLWNGAMSDWNTSFVEVPLSTFNPVKTVNDLLRPMHQ